MGFDFRFSFHWYFLFTVYRSSISGSAADSVWVGHPLTAAETIVSSGGRFALGFFTPDSVSLYLGIWYNQDGNKSILWVANREAPITRNDPVLCIAGDGNLVITTDNGSRTVWEANSIITLVSRNSAAVLTDSGNLVLQDAMDSDTVLWKSFWEPTDTFLPEMMIQVKLGQGEQRVLTSWRSPIDPSPGNYSMGADANGPPQVVLWEGLNRRWRSGHWNGFLFTGVPAMKPYLWFGFKLIQSDGKLLFTYTPSNTSKLVKFKLSCDGVYVEEQWVDKSRVWEAKYRYPEKECDKYNYCGNFGKCRQFDSEKCSCLEGFESKHGGGCFRKKGLQCWNGHGEPDGFLQVENVKLPDFVDYVGPGDVKSCQSICWKNCSCTAFAFVSGINCMVWTQDLVDVQQFEEGGNTLFVRVAHSELGDKNRVKKAIIITSFVIGGILICASIFLLWKCNRKHYETLNINEMLKISTSGEFSSELSGVEGSQTNGNELISFNFSSLVTATDNFSDENKLGEGGFGQVHKGKLSGGQEVAVKRLSRKSSQGLEEFKNEIMLIANLQHRNLVRLLGCCIHGEEKLLLYEYMPNKSLDSYIFDNEKKSRLDWGKRFSIIGGIARGLLYLHRDSRLRIIHRDLKASNILLDEQMNPKISDFGMARMFGGGQDQANTNRVVGTYGYMAPEYAMEGLFSLKSDVYSFGVLLLEIITGQRNSGFRLSEYSNIIGYAWNRWDGNRAFELLDPSISESGTFLEEQVLRCVHVGMLCVQDVASHRPDMAAVVLMLESENTTLPMPREPGFGSIRREHLEIAGVWSGGVQDDGSSNNNVTMSAILGR